MCGRPPWFSGPPLARALKPRGGGRPASRARPLSRPPSPPTYRNMVETWNITRGRVGAPPRRPPMGALLGHPFPAGCLSLRSGAPRPDYCMRAWSGRRAGFPPRAGRFAPRPALLRTPRPHLRRGPCPCAGPLRRGAPAAASRARSGGIRPRPRWGLAGPAPRASPPAPPLGPCCGLGLGASPSRGARWPRLTGASPRFAAGSLTGGRPCFVSGSPLVSAWPRRVPPGAPADAASGAAGSCPGGLSAAYRPRFYRPGPPGLFSSPAPARAPGGGPRCCLVRSFHPLYLVVRFSPKPPPVPRPRWGPGERRADLRLVASFSAAGKSRNTFPRNGPFSRSLSHC